jgi:TPR repeat protein
MTIRTRSALGALVALAFSAGFASAAPLDDGIRAAQTGNYAAAFMLLTPFAEGGNADAQFILGVLTANGRGVPEDPMVAARWYRMAAEQGMPESQNNLGALYSAGEGVPHDHAVAFRWWSLAAERGFGRSQLNLAGLYLDGEGVKQDYVQAYKWARLAQLLGEAQAPKVLDRLRAVMTPEQVEEGDILVRDWQPSTADRL